MSISIVIPVFNEADNVRPLHQCLMQVLPRLGQPCEVIFIDDGSTDGTYEQLHVLARDYGHVRVIQLRRNFGQTAALAAGVHAAQGDVIVTIDGDLQNEPEDIPLFLAKLAEGYDFVHGWRKSRQDTFLTRQLPSRAANWLISKVTGFSVRDIGCGLKVMRREVAKELSLCGQMHRFIPLLAHWQGARTAELVTRHHPRLRGRTKYGLLRTVHVLLDLLALKFMMHNRASPMKVFGSLGLICLCLAVATGVVTGAAEFTPGIEVVRISGALASVFFAAVGICLVALGTDCQIRTQFLQRSPVPDPYAVTRRINFDCPFYEPCLDSDLARRQNAIP